MALILRAFLEKCKKENTVITISPYMSSGKLSTGKIVDYDEEYVLLRGIDSRGKPNELVINVHAIYSLCSESKERKDEEKFKKIMSALAQGLQNPRLIEEGMEGQESLVTLMQVDPLTVEVGQALISLADREKEPNLLERVGSVRKHIAMEMGIIIPGVRFRDNLHLKSNAYVIKIKDVKVAKGEVVMGQLLALGHEQQLKHLKGIKTLDPTYGMPGMWISPEEKNKAETSGCMIFDPVSVIATHITEAIRKNGSDLLGREETIGLIENFKRTHPMSVENLIPEVISYGMIQKILQNLIKERVSIRDLATIMETLEDCIHVTKDPERLAEYARQALARTISRDYANNQGIITALTLDSSIEQTIMLAIQKEECCSLLAQDSKIGQKILKAVGRQIEKMNEKRVQPILLCPPEARPWIKKLTEHSFPELAVLSYKEIAPGFSIHNWANPISLEEEEEKVLQESSACRSEK
ncbi:MAG: flagellar biosynthesis protein FlhA [Candidatus Eremiobacteraeota bacterium]|nr:flagellar biosynthesis protein FlhA [Candidatus Eremiobacteraeota bacterium]MCL5055796.1 flagellar biosynthesis protein FlhA [Bacillota bacterium]